MFRYAPDCSPNFAILFIATNNQLQSPPAEDDVLSSAGRDQIAADEDEREQHQDEIEWSKGMKCEPHSYFMAGGELAIATRQKCLVVEHRGSDRDRRRKVTLATSFSEK